MPVESKFDTIIDSLISTINIYVAENDELKAKIDELKSENDELKAKNNKLKSKKDK